MSLSGKRMTILWWCISRPLAEPFLVSRLCLSCIICLFKSTILISKTTTDNFCTLPESIASCITCIIAVGWGTLHLFLHVKWAHTKLFDFKCQSLNVKGLNKSIKHRSVFRRMHNQNFHFIFLQETQLKTMRSPLGGRMGWQSLFQPRY